MSFDITKHRYYRPHIKLNNNEKSTFIKKYGTKIPILLKNDPVSKIFDFRRGDVIKIIRKEDFISYRIVK